jgi:Holliday junction resolvase-like predicted endonuclease
MYKSANPAMSIERDLIISLLKLTTEGYSSKETVKKDANLPLETVEKLLRRLQNDKLIYLRKDIVEVSTVQRLKLAVQAVGSGGDIERISGFLQWKEFEKIAALALERNGCGVKTNLRFKYGGRRWEIDIVGYKRPIAICMDCKHWHRQMSPSTLKKVVGDQVERTSALVESLPNPAVKAAFVSWDSVKFIPAVLSLVTGRFKFYNKVPVVAILQLQDFLSQLPVYADSLKHFAGP